jgi:hypothetical protein
VTDLLLEKDKLEEDLRAGTGDRRAFHSLTQALCETKKS